MFNTSSRQKWAYLNVIPEIFQEAASFVSQLFLSFLFDHLGKTAKSSFSPFSVNTICLCTEQEAYMEFVFLILANLV